MSLCSIVVLGAIAQWAAWRVQLPSILLLLILGFVAGPITGLVNPDDLLGNDLLFPLVSLCVGLILFEGGLSLKLNELGTISRPLWNLLTVGVVISMILTTIGAVLILDMSSSAALVLAAILVVTGPTVVGPMLRHIRPTGRVGPIAKWEGIVIDPIGAVLAVLIFESREAVQEASYQNATLHAALGLTYTALSGVVIGMLAACLIWYFLKRYWIPDMLHVPVVLAGVAAAFTGANMLQEESGLLAVTLMGIFFANQKSVRIQHIVEFKENLRVLLISSLFILLAARLRFEDFTDMGLYALLFLAFMVIIVRPVVVFACTMFSDLKWTERLFLAWLAPRGIVAAAVASVFGLRMGEHHEGLATIVFMVIIGTVAIYGLTAPWAARRLGLSSANPQGLLLAGAHLGARSLAKILQDSGFRVVLIDSNRRNIQKAQMEGLSAYYASVLSESIEEEINLGGLGRFLALTSNDEVNSLAAMHFREIFGRAEIYQLPPVEQKGQRLRKAEGHLQGRRLFAPQANYYYFVDRFEDGAVIKKTQLTNEFNFENFQEHYKNTALPMFVITETRRLIVFTTEKNLTPKPGQAIIALVDRVSVGSETQENDSVAK